LTVISKVPYEFFLSLPCLSRKRKTVSFTGERRKKEKERERETILELNSISRSDFWCHSFTTLQQPTELAVCLIWTKTISNANINSRLNKNWFLGIFPPYTLGNVIGTNINKVGT
jgi:hypothetical protein